MYKIPAILFAGGKSSRMGQDKALMPFANAPSMSAYQYKKLSLLFEEVYISAKTDKFSFDCKVIEDRYQESSPLVALVSLLESMQSDAFFILSVDAPLVDADTIEKLMYTYEQMPISNAIIARSPKGPEPLCGIYTKKILPLARQHLLENNHKMQALLGAASPYYVDFDMQKIFSNVNTPEEYKNAMLLVNR